MEIAEKAGWGRVAVGTGRLPQHTVESLPRYCGRRSRPRRTRDDRDPEEQAYGASLHGSRNVDLES